MRLLGICDVTSTFWPICETMATRKPADPGLRVFQLKITKPSGRRWEAGALMEMSNQSNNAAPNLFRGRNQLHSGAHPSMLFIRVGPLLKQSLHAPTQTHTHTHTHKTLVCSYRPLLIHALDTR